MIAVLRSSLAFLGLLLLAVWLVPLGRLALHQLLIGDRIISLPFGWLSWPDLLVWSYLAVCFLGLGALVFRLNAVPRPVLWATALGVSYSLIRLFGSHYWFSDTAHWTSFVWMYGDLLIPPLAAPAGACMARGWGAGRASHASTA